jgi:filamentous hemagglutinin family protein
MGNNSKIKHSLTWSFWLKKVAMVFFVVIAIEAIYANPTGGVVTAGDATISQTATTTQINQSSDKAIINWNSFNIGANEATHFQQPNANSITLNRINPDQGASQIFGQLTSNGRIVLVNQSGFFFGSGAYVNVGGLIASTAGITDQNFLAGKMIFDQVSATHRGTIINQGTMIAANNGLIALIGANVSNEGVIQANSGHVILASGNKFTLDLGGDGLINFVVDEASTSSGLDQNGHVMTDGVKNTGSIIANGGKILLTARDAAGVVDKAINMSGVAQARSVSQKNGEIIFSASDDGVVEVSGALLDVSGKYANETGGVIKVLGSNIVIENSSVLDASGNLGGGTILIGGNFHGAGPEQNALTTLIDSSVTINANALTYGNGGKVAVWADLYTLFQGSITAQGGVFAGDGGYIETSAEYLNVNGARINTFAFNGNKGTWLLDPLDIVIDVAADNNVTGSSPFIPTGTASLLSVSTLMSALSVGNVIVDTTGTVGAGNGDITVNSTVSLPGGTPGSLTLNAAGNILLNASIVMGNASNQNTNLNLNATSGTISDGAAIFLGGFNITLNASQINFTHGSSMNAFGDLNVGGGTLTMIATGAGANALNLQSMSLSTQSTGGSIGQVILQASNPSGGISLDNVSICIGNFCGLSITTPSLTIGSGGLQFDTSTGTQYLTLNGSAPTVNFVGGGTSTAFTNTTISSGIFQVNNGADLSYAGNLIINSGGELLLNGATITNDLSLSGTGVGNAGALATTGSVASVINSNVTLTGATLIGITNSGDSLTLGVNKTIGGAEDLTLSGAGTFILRGFIGNATIAPASLTSNVAMIFNFSNKLITDGNQTYNGAVTFLNTPVAFTTNNGGTITFANTIIGNGYDAFLDSGASTGTVSLQNASTQNWHITGSDTGTVVGILSGGGAFSFGGFGSVTGGSGTNIFTFDNNFATLSGTVNGGAGTGTIDLTAYSAPIQIQMGGQYSGALVDNTLAPIANYANVQTINGSAGSTLQTANKTNVIVISQQQPTGSGSGYVNDPFNFSNITHFVGQGYTTMTLPSSAIVNSSNTFTYLGVTYYYSGISGFNSNVPTPTPTPVPTPSVVPVDVANVMAQFTQRYYTTQLTQAPTTEDSTSGSSSSSSGSNSASEPVLPGTLFVIQGTTAFSQQVQSQLDQQPLKIVTQGACGL